MHNQMQKELTGLQMDLILVHGGGLRENGELYTHVKDRVDSAVHVLKDGYAPRMVVSDGLGSKAMKAYAKSQGVPEYRILLEPYARSTAENILYTLQAYIRPGRLDGVHLVSSHWHGGRVRMLAKRYLKGKVWDFVPAPDSRPDSEKSRDIAAEKYKTLIDFLTPTSLQSRKGDAKMLLDRRNGGRIRAEMERNEMEKVSGVEGILMGMEAVDNFAKTREFPIYQSTASNMDAVFPENDKISKNFKFFTDYNERKKSDDLRKSFTE